MGLTLFVLLFGAIFGGIAFVQYRTREVRARTVALLAARIGFTFSRADPSHVRDMPFWLFQQGKGRKVQLVITGAHNDLPLSLFDYEYYVQGDRTREYHRFTCAVLTVPAACPPLRIARETMMTRLGEHLGVHDVKLEYDDFNRRFHVSCKDQRFAFTLLDGQMMQWLLDARYFTRLEVVGPWVMIAGDRLDPKHWGELATWLDAFHAHIPPVLYTTYPPQ